MSENEKRRSRRDSARSPLPRGAAESGGDEQAEEPVFRQSLEPLPRTLFVGLGSSHGDDRLGWLLADALATQCPARLIVKQAGHPHELLHWLEGIDRLLVGDACESTGAPGKIRRWSWPAPEIRRLRSSGTHDFDLATVLELAGCLDALPHGVTIWSIEAESFQPNAPVSEAVTSSIPELVRQIQSCLP